MSDSALEELKDKARLELTLQTRERIITDLMSEGIPDDRHDRALLISALDGMDRTVLSKAKLKSDDAAVRSQRDTARMIADVLTRVTAQPSIIRTIAPTLHQDIALTSVVPGELDIGTRDLSYDEFMDQT